MLDVGCSPNTREVAVYRVKCRGIAHLGCSFERIPIRALRVSTFATGLAREVLLASGCVACSAQRKLPPDQRFGLNNGAKAQPVLSQGSSCSTVVTEFSLPAHLAIMHPRK